MQEAGAKGNARSTNVNELSRWPGSSVCLVIDVWCLYTGNDARRTSHDLLKTCKSKCGSRQAISPAIPNLSQSSMLLGDQLLFLYDSFLLQFVNDSVPIRYVFVYTVSVVLKFAYRAFTERDYFWERCLFWLEKKGGPQFFLKCSSPKLKAIFFSVM